MADGAQIGLVLAFLAGFVSFLSPCIAPLVPGYLALLSGAASDGGQTRVKGPNWRLMHTSFSFVAGFTLMFVALGASAVTIGGLLEAHRTSMLRLSGAFMVVMGFVMLGVFRLPWLLRERRWHREPRRFAPSETLLLGAAFGFGWTPCLGPVLAVILAYTSTVETVQQGTALLTAYSLGLGVPFLLIGVGLGWIDGFARWLRRWSGLMNAASGLVLIAIGVLFATDRFFFISIAVQRFYYTLVGG